MKEHVLMEMQEYLKQAKADADVMARGGKPANRYLVDKDGAIKRFPGNGRFNMVYASDKSPTGMVSIYENKGMRYLSAEEIVPAIMKRQAERIADDKRETERKSSQGRATVHGGKN